MRRRTAALLALVAVLAALSLVLWAADVVTDGNMELAGIVNWPHTNVTGTNTSAKDTVQKGGGAQSLKGTSQTGSKLAREWYNTQSVGTIGAGSTVTLSFWYGYQHFVNVGGGATTTLFVESKAASAGTWTQLWTSGAQAGNVTFQSATVAAQDVSASFSTTDTYQIRLRVTGQTGNNAGAYFAAWWDNIVLDVTAPAVVTTLGNGVVGSNATVCPGASGQKLDGFSFVNNSGTNGVTALTVTTTNQAAIASMQIWNEAGTTQYFTTVNNPGSNTWNFSGGTTIPVGTTAANFKVLATYYGHASAPAGNTATTAYVSAFTTANNKAGSDAADTTLTLDNAAATAATWGTNTAGDASITLNWTLGTGGDSVVVVRYAANTDTTMPTDGTTYVVGNSFGTGGTIRFVGTGSTTTDNSGLVNETTYYYRIFEYDTCLNYAATAPWTSGLTPQSANKTTVGTVTASSSGCNAIGVTASYTGDPDGDNSLSYRYRTPSGSGAWSSATLVSHGASPYGFTIPSLTFGATYDVEITYVDPDGDTGTNPQTVNNILVGANCTAAGTATAAQTPGATPSIAVSAPYTSDGDGDNTLSYRYRLTSGAYGAPVNLSHSASPYAFTISGLTCGSTYDVEVTYADADGIGSGTAVQTISGIPVNNCTSAGTPSATVDACNQITVSAPFSGDANGNGTTNFERGPSGTGPWTAVCTGKTGASPRSCVDAGVSASSTYYYRVTYSDADGISGTAQQVIGPFNTPPCATPPVTPGVPTATVDSCTQITASAPYTGDTNGNSSTTFRIGPSGTGPWTDKCAGVTGASPRSCILSGLTQDTAYYIQVDFTDADGVGGTDPQVIGPFTTSDCRVAPQAASATVNTCNRITVSAPFSGDWNANSTTTVRRGSALAGPFNDVICNGLAGATPRSCVDNTAQGSTTYYYQVAFADADGVNGSATQVVGPIVTPACSDPKTTPGSVTLTAASCNSIIASASFTGDGNGNGTTRFEVNTSNTWPGTVSCAAVSGASPRQCTISGLTPGATYWVRAVFTDPDGLSGSDPAAASVATPSPCGADTIAPTVLFQSPTRGAVIGGLERVKVQVYDAGGLGGLTVQWKVDGGVLAATSTNANYACGTNCAICEFSVNTTGGVLGGVAPLSLTNNDHVIWVQARDAAGNVSLKGLSVKVNNVGGSPTSSGTAAAGNGLLLRRTHGSELCIDCHNLKTHTSQETSTKYGNWALDCLTCHTPHTTTNIHLVKNEIQTPNSGVKTIQFKTDDKSGSTNPQNSYLGAYDAGGSPYDDGVCEACHTKTNHYRNDSSGGDHTHNQNQRCVGCHKHNEGFKGAGCNGCHKGPPTVGKHGAHDEIWDSTEGNTATSYTDTASHGTATQYGFACAKCHDGTHANDTHAGTAGDPYRVEVAFDATSNPMNPAGAYSQVYPGGAPSPDQGLDTTKYWSWTPTVAGTDGQCANLYCHSNASPVGGGTNSYAPVQWNQAAALTCASCHATTGATAAGQTLLSRKHASHINGGAGNYTFTCDECHAETASDNSSSAIADKTKHVNGAKDWKFSATSTSGAVDQSAGTYDMAGTKTCSGIYCHSQGRSTTSPFGGSPNSDLAWTAGTATCESCHSGNASATNKMGTSAHGAHMNQAAYLGTNLMCSRCHQDTVSSASDTAINTASFHVNGSRDVRMSDGGTWNGTTCTNSYCHSNGTETPTYVASVPNWSGGTLANTCKTCHGTEGGSIAGEPRYANNTASFNTRNGHLLGDHVSAATDCVKCHDTAVNADGTLKAGGVHLNGSREVHNTAYIASYDEATETCTTISCHGGNSAVWGGTLYCVDCHGGAGDVDNWNITDGTPSIISTAEWAYSGHGKPVGSNYDVTNNAPANFGAGGANPCLYCHDDAVTHKVGANPFRLRSSATTNQVCLNCHATGSAGVQPAGYSLINGASKINGYHYGAKHGAGNSGKFCWDCHEPHGDRTSGSGNIAMVRSNVTTQSDGTYGIPSTSAAVTFTAHSTGADFAKTTNPYNGICNVCHTTALHYRNNSGDGHMGGSGCVASCHTHDQAPNLAFAQKSTCNACHNAPPPVSAGRHAKHDETGTVPTSYTNLTADTTATQYGFACAKCHSGTHANDSTHAGTAASPYQVEVAFDNTVAPMNGGGTYSQIYNDAVDPGTDPIQNFSWTNDTSPSASGKCTNIYCHSNAAPVGGTDNKASVSVYWNQAAGSVTCTSCHNTAGRSDTAVATDLSNAHGKHIKSTSGETGSYAYKCDECHSGIIRDNPNDPWALAAADLTDKRNHVTGTHSVQFSTTLLSTAINQSAGSYVQAPTYTCTGTYCHSGGVATASPFSATASAAVAWNSSATCRSCHGWDAAAAPTIGVAAGSSFQGSAKHANHVANATVIGTNYVCADCHVTAVSAGNSPVTSQALHVNGVKDISIATRGTYTSSDTTATCSSTYCHSDGRRGGANTKKTATWTDAAWAGNICIKCHGSTTGTLFGAPDYANGGPDTSTANSHAKHVDAAADCTVCHKNTTTTGTSILAGAVHTNGVITLVFDTTVAGGTVSATSGTFTGPATYTSATCTNVLCHGTNATAVKWGATSVFCVDCHGGASDVNNWAIADGTPSKINTGAEWTTYGHGSATVNLAQGKTGIDVCRYCHDWNVNHKVATNPFRLLGATGANGAITSGNYNAATNYGNAVCWNCHGTGSNGVDPDGSAGTAYLLKNGAKKIDSYHYGATHTANGTTGGQRCWDCHDVHGDATNLAMIGSDTLRQASDAYGLTGTRSTTAAVLTTQGSGGYTNTTTRNGICQVCHTATKYWRSTSEPTAHNNPSDCTAACHAHDQTSVNTAFAGKGGGSDCYGCHGPGQGGTRALSGDFTKQSHHVRTNVGAFGGATKAAGWGTNEDCVVCHMEGQIVTSACSDCPSGTFPMACTNPTYHANGKIDLRNVDVAAPAADGTGTSFLYDKDLVTAVAGATLSNWSSKTQRWREWTSGVNEVGNDGTDGVLPTNAGLDKFCLSCHDSDGAAQIATFKISTEANRTATDPFWDGATNITNTYDQMSRGRVTDIKSKVSGAPPAQGSFARHAIRGQSTSKYANYLTASAWSPNPNSYSTIYSAGKFTSNGTDEGGKPNWNDTSVMGCADCHTTDGGNTTNGNAHGSVSEYLLKDSTGAAIEGSFNGGNENCALCHNNYGTAHTGGNGSDFDDSVTQVGAARLTASTPKAKTGTMFGLACINCHGGAQGNGTGTGDNNGFGWIHGTSQVFVQGAGGTRNAYRFMNGSSLRYYTPGNTTTWDTGGGTCYTLGTADTWGNCTQHSGGTSMGPSLKRPLTY